MNWKAPVASPRRYRRAFTLVEMAMATGIVSFAMVGIMGLIPVGLTSFRSAIHLSVESTIAQRLASDVQRTGYANLPDERQLLYFDEQGVPTAAAGSAVFTAEVSPPQSLNTGGITAAAAPARTVVIRITGRMEPTAVSYYSVIIPTES